MTLRKSLESRIRQGHPWVFRDALADPPRLADGTPVLVRARNRRPLAVGFWDATSPIAVRLLAVDPPASLSLPDLVAPAPGAGAGGPPRPPGHRPDQRLPLGARRGATGCRACTSICTPTWRRSASTARARGRSTGGCPSCWRPTARPLRLRAVVDREPAAAGRGGAGRAARCARTACSFGGRSGARAEGRPVPGPAGEPGRGGPPRARQDGAEPVRLHRRLLAVRRRRRCPSHRHRGSRPRPAIAAARAQLRAQPAGPGRRRAFTPRTPSRSWTRARRRAAALGHRHLRSAQLRPPQRAPCRPRAGAYRRLHALAAAVVAPRAACSAPPRAPATSRAPSSWPASATGWPGRRPPLPAGEPARRRLRSPGAAVVPRGGLPEVRALPRVSRR